MATLRSRQEACQFRKLITLCSESKFVSLREVYLGYCSVGVGVGVGVAKAGGTNLAIPTTDLYRRGG